MRNDHPLTPCWQWVNDILEQSATGRVLEYDPATGATRMVAGGLSFANGVTLSQDEQTLFMSETGQHKG